MDANLGTRGANLLSPPPLERAPERSSARVADSRSSHHRGDLVAHQFVGLFAAHAVDLAAPVRSFIREPTLQSAWTHGQGAGDAWKRSRPTVETIPKNLADGVGPQGSKHARAQSRTGRIAGELEDITDPQSKDRLDDIGILRGACVAPHFDCNL